METLETPLDPPLVWGRLHLGLSIPKPSPGLCSSSSIMHTAPSSRHTHRQTNIMTGCYNPRACALRVNDAIRMMICFLPTVEPLNKGHSILSLQGGCPLSEVKKCISEHVLFQCICYLYSRTCTDTNAPILINTSLFTLQLKLSTPRVSLGSSTQLAFYQVGAW